MACHEVAALRLGMMNVIGIRDEATIRHERAEIGEERLNAPGPIRSLAEAKDFESLIKFYEASLTDLEEMISKTKKDDPKMAYYRSLLILTKKIEFELKNSIFTFQNLFRDLEEIHDFVHEIFPA